MDTKNISMEDISQKPLKFFESKASGILFVSKQTFHDFVMDAQRDSFLQTAIAIGISAAKKTSEIYPLCHQIPLSSVEIDIIPSSEIQSLQFEFSSTFIPSFKPKKFVFQKDIHTPATQEIPLQNTETTLLQLQKEKIEKGKKQFKNMQKMQINSNKKFNPSGQCGFQVHVKIKAQWNIAPNIECLNAVNATLIGLFNLLKTNHRDMIITQVQLETSE